MRKLKRNRNKNESYVFVLVKSYLLFTLFVLALAVAMIYLHISIMNYLFQNGQVDRLEEANVKRKLTTEKYQDLDASRLLGKNGYFEILDEKQKLLYSSRPSKKNNYTANEVRLIRSYFGQTDYRVGNYEVDGKDGRIIIEKFSYSDSGDDYNKISGYAILDGTKKFIEDTIGLDDGRGYLSEREYQILQIQDPAEKNGFIYKYQFETSGKDKRVLILHLADIPLETYKKSESLSMMVIPVFVVVYIIITIGFIIYMYKKVKNPLSQLNDAIVGFTEGKRETTMDFSGPAEFAQICNSFNVMSERVQQGEEQKQLLMDEKQKMLADISHDLKTPITVIQGYAKAIFDGLVEEKEKNKYLETIYHKANGLADLIQIFYEYSRLEHPDFTMNMEETDLCEFARAYLARKYDEIDRAGFLLEADIPEEACMCSIDSLQIRRVFDNLIGNALRHNPVGTTIYFNLRDHEDTVSITVGDDGTGIPENIAENLFQPFIVGDESRNNRGGSGLGLAIAGKIIAMHQGTIRLVLPPSSPMATEIEMTIKR